MSGLLVIEEPRPAQAPAPASAPAATEGTPVLHLGFRPFYLLGVAFAAVLPVLWIATLAGLVRMESAVPGGLWHGHEMLFGVVIAIIVGFLFTAGRTWTGLPTPTGPFLGALALLWLAARLAAVFAPTVLFMALDLAFLPLAAAVFLDLVVRARNRRNMPMAVLLMLLATANAAFHAAHLGLLPLAPTRVLQAAVLLVVAVMSIVAGRVIPAFIVNAVPGSRPRVNRHVERLVLPLTATVVLSWLVAPASRWTALVLGAMALLHVARLLLWKPWVARSLPILWILPAGYAWIPVGLVLLAAANQGIVPPSLALHALAAGAMGTLIVGMVSRTSRGHTGRPLRAGAAERWAYALVLAGACLRVAAPVLGAELTFGALVLAAAAWSGAFAILFITLWPWLTAPRVDGKPG